MIIAICILLLLPLFLLSLYVRPSADDYDYALLTHAAIENGGSVFAVLSAAWDTVVKFYMTWQGTYSSAFIMSLQPGIWGPKFYVLTPFLVLGFSYFCLFVSVFYINKWFIQKSNLYTATVSLVILTVLFLWLPSPCQGLFWYNGAMHYVPWFFATVLNIVLLLESGFSASPRRRARLLLLASILSFLISGGNQVTAFANILLMLALVLFHPAGRRRDVLIPLFVAVAGFMIMFVAPGNAVRQGDSVNKSVVETVVRVFRHSIPQFTEWISLNWFVSMILVTPVALEIARKNTRPISVWILPVTAAVSYAVLCGMLCVIYMPTGSYGDGRLTNVIWFAFMVFSWINYYLLVTFFSSQKFLVINVHGHPFKWTILVGACLVVLFAGQSGYMRSSSFTACVELSAGTAQQYAAELDQRYLLYEDDSVKEVAVPPLTTAPWILSHMDIEPDAGVWPNLAIAKYYHKDKVYILQENSD